MKKNKPANLKKEYKLEDLGKGERGKYYENYSKGTNLVLLSPDVAEVFKDEKSVNEALRSLIKVAQDAVGK